MSDNKKDLTRIEDLGEFLHEMDESSEESLNEQENLAPPELPATEESTLNLDNTSDFSSGELSSDFEHNSEEAFPSNEDNNSFTLQEDNSFTDNNFEQENTISLEGENNEQQNSPSSFEESHEQENNFLEEIAQPQEPISSFKEEEKEEEIKEIEITRVPENFEEIKTFSENTSLTGQGVEANPSFSLLVKEIKYLEDIEDILTLLREFKLITDSEEQTRARLTRGSLLIPRISEYAAIYLAHKLRRFNVEIELGPSDEIHPPKHQEKPEIGLVSKFNIFQNKTHNFEFNDKEIELNQIIVSSTTNLDHYQILKYIGIASEHAILEKDSIQDEDSSDLQFHYKDLAQKLKVHAQINQANAVVGINYQITPIPTELGSENHKYRLSCTGNLVWVNKL